MSATLFTVEPPTRRAAPDVPTGETPAEANQASRVALGSPGVQPRAEMWHEPAQLEVSCERLTKHHAYKHPRDLQAALVGKRLARD